MFRPKGKHGLPPRAVLEPPVAETLGLTSLASDANDDGISLEELGEAYAALLAKGTDPYPNESDAGVADDAEAIAGKPGTTHEIKDEAASGQITSPGELAVRRIVDGNDDRGCEITPRSILEAILFVGHPLNEPLSSRQIAGLMRGVTADEIDDLVGELNDEYERERAPYRVQSRGAGYLLELREEFAPLRDKFYGRITEVRLTQTAIEVLAIVAYNQPITLAEIDRIRGRCSGSAVSQLVRRDLLACERTDDKGAKPTYRTTGRFLDLYGLESLEDLPQVDRSTET